jgi:hypothetical protein
MIPVKRIQLQSNPNRPALFHLQRWLLSDQLAFHGAARIAFVVAVSMDGSSVEERSLMVIVPDGRFSLNSPSSFRVPDVHLHGS